MTRLNYGQRSLAGWMFLLGLFIDVSKEQQYARIRNTTVLTSAIEYMKRPKNSHNIQGGKLIGGLGALAASLGQTHQIAANAGGIGGNKRDASV